MKNPLSYQSTEYDCGPTTMINAINYLFKREEIYPDVIKCIMQYTLDCYNTKGEAYKHGTTGMAMMYLANWLNHFGKVKNWPIYCEMVSGKQVYIGENSPIAVCLKNQGVVVARVMLGCWHYVLITGMDQEYVYVFDPYYRKKPFIQKGIEMIDNEPTRMNRKILWEYLNSEEKKGLYALGNIEQREAMLIYHSSIKRVADSIEYYI